MHRTPVYAVSWTDGTNPDSDKGCSLVIARMAVAAALVLCALALGGTAWSGRKAGRS